MKRASELISKQLKIQKKEGYNPLSIEMEMLCKDGGTVWMEVKASFLRDDDGNITGILGVSRNITERKKIEQSLYESEARFKALHNASFGGIAIHDKGIILDCNQGLSDMTGYSITELIEINGLLLIAENSRSSVMNNIVSGYEKPYEAVGLRKNGEEFPMRLEGRNIPYKGKDVRVVEFRDITEQKQMEKTIRETSELLSLFVKNLPFYFYIKKVTPTENRVLEASQNFIQMLGIPRDEVIDKTPEELFPKELAMQIIADDLSVVLNKKIIQKDENFNGRNYTTIKFPIVQGDKTLLAGYTIDITDRKQAELKQKELEAINLRLQKAESLGQMAGGIAHLFNNYLYAVSGNLEMALEDLSEESLIRDNLIQAMKAARRCSDVSGSMLHYLGQNFAKTESLDIVEFCRKTLPDFQSQSPANSGITIETNLMDAELFVRVNGNQMQQVLNHLITNACESIGENKGKINLVTRTIKGSDIPKLHLLPVDFKPSSDNYACVEITDTGCGISAEDIHKISDPFFTTKFTGRGLGLSVVLGIVKSWGGCVGVNSEIGSGSSFMVFLPIYVDNSVRPTKKLSQSPQPQQKGFSTVLLVEDHEMVRNMAIAMLKRMGFEVISAVNGVEAVEKFRQHKESISCLITDLSMPELDGWGTLAEIRKINPHIPAILASGYDEAFAMSRDDSEKPQAFLHKPYSMADLKSALGQAMDYLYQGNYL
jgi:PAS domain S-box-containing protein